MWRFAFREELPTDFGDVLKDTAFEFAKNEAFDVAASEEQILGVPPFANIYQLGGDIKNLDVQGAANDLDGALNNPDLRQGLFQHWSYLQDDSHLLRWQEAAERVLDPLRSMPHLEARPRWSVPPELVHPGIGRAISKRAAIVWRC